MVMKTIILLLSSSSLLSSLALKNDNLMIGDVVGLNDDRDDNLFTVVVHHLIF